MQRFEQQLLTKKTKEEVRGNYESGNVKNDDMIFAVQLAL